MTIVEIRVQILTRTTHLNILVQHQKESSIIMTFTIIHAINGKTQPSIAGIIIGLMALFVNHWDISLHPLENTVRVGMMLGMRLQHRTIQIIVVHLAQSLNTINVKVIIA